MIFIIAGAISTLYGMVPDNKSIKSRENLQATNINMVDAKQDLKETQRRTFLVYHKFLKDSEIKINQNKRIFAEFKLMLSKINLKNKATCQNQLNGVEQKNNNLNKMLANYKKEKRHYKWASLKKDFNLDLDKLETMMWGMD